MRPFETTYLTKYAYECYYHRVKIVPNNISDNCVYIMYTSITK